MCVVTTLVKRRRLTARTLSRVLGSCCTSSLLHNLHGARCHHLRVEAENKGPTVDNQSTRRSKMRHLGATIHILGHQLMSQGGLWPGAFASRGTIRSLSKQSLKGVGGRASASRSIVRFFEPPEILVDGFFERPTPFLLIAGECHPPEWWDYTASFFAQRGCTVGVMALTGKGITSTDKLALKALQAGVAAAVERSGLTPPVIVASSVGGFVSQQYLESYGASGLVLLDPYPPEPAVLAMEYLATALTADRQKNLAAAIANVVDLKGLAELVKDDPSRWEGMLWRYFGEVHGGLRWVTPLPGDGRRAVYDTLDSASRPRFPAKALGEMCLGKQSAILRLERHVVDTLVLGSDRAFEIESLEKARVEGLEATASFHGAREWRAVDHAGIGESSQGKRKPWQELVWDWYQERF